MKKYVIQDWASNTLQHNKKFNRSAYNSKDLGLPMTFKTFDDAEEYLSELLGDNYDESRGEYYIEEATC